MLIMRTIFQGKRKGLQVVYCYSKIDDALLNVL